MTKDLELKAKERKLNLVEFFHQQREIIENIYAKLIALREAVFHYGLYRLGDTAGEKYKILDAVFKEFRSYYFPKAIYLPDRVIGNIAKLTIVATALINNYKNIAQYEKLDRDTEVEARLKINYENSVKFEGDFDACINTVANDFQIILGIKHEAAV